MPANVRDILKNALRQLESEKERVDSQIAALRGVLGGMNSRGGAAGTERRRRPMSAAERRAVSQRMKAYWAKRRAAKKRTKAA